MRWFNLGGSNAEDPAAAERREASLRSIEQGGLPLNAIDRLREQASRQGTPGHIFTSDLSVNELAVVAGAGYAPLGQVMGSSVYHVGWQWLPGWSSQSGELTVITHAYYEARRLALGRLQEEARLLGADGVVGARISEAPLEGEPGLIEFQALGTAVRKQSPTAAPPRDPFVCNLSGREFYLLLQAGYMPVGFAFGNCTYYQVPTWSTQNAMQGGYFGGSWYNQELPDYTQAVYNARSLAVGRMEHEARAVNAVGILGAAIAMEIQPREVGSDNNRRIDIIYHFTAFGTAIAPQAGRWPQFIVDQTVPLLG